MRRNAGRIKPDLHLGLNSHPSCRGKRAYSSFTVARDQAKQTRRNTGGTVAPYHWAHCSGWHVGTPKPKTRQLKENVRD